MTSKPAVGEDIAFPSYFAEQLAAKIVQSGGTVVSAGEVMIPALILSRSWNPTAISICW